jgi:hypothetical protein
VNVHTESASRPLRAGAPAALSRLRRGSLAVLVLIAAEFGIGMYVNLYVTVPRADHGGSLGTAISNGPAALSLHAVVGLLLGLGALGVLVQSVMARHWAAVAFSAAGLLALGFASVAGTGFTATGDASASMAMSGLTAVAVVCYAANIYALRPPGPRGQPGEAAGGTGRREQ